MRLAHTHAKSISTDAALRLGISSDQLASPETYEVNDAEIQAELANSQQSYDHPRGSLGNGCRGAHPRVGSKSWLATEREQYVQFLKQSGIPINGSKNTSAPTGVNVSESQIQDSELWKCPGPLRESPLTQIFSAANGRLAKEDPEEFQRFLWGLADTQDAAMAGSEVRNLTGSTSGSRLAAPNATQSTTSASETSSRLYPRFSFRGRQPQRASGLRPKSSSRPSQATATSMHSKYRYAAPSRREISTSACPVQMAQPPTEEALVELPIDVSNAFAGTSASSSSAAPRVSISSGHGSTGTVGAAELFNASLLKSFGSNSIPKLCAMLQEVDEHATDLRPRDIVEELNRHIVSQDAAKKAVAIALRNRWRRGRLSDCVKDDVTPTNILMYGPTGSGKSAIARRLAKFVQAPFIKVEATKFTEVGFIGRDVESIIKDLVEVGIAQVRQQVVVRHACLQQYWAENLILSLLFPQLLLEPFDRVMKGWKPNATPSSAIPTMTSDSAYRARLREGAYDDAIIELDMSPFVLGNLANAYFQNISFMSVTQHPSKPMFANVNEASRTAELSSQAFAMGQELEEVSALASKGDPGSPQSHLHSQVQQQPQSSLGGDSHVSKATPTPTRASGIGVSLNAHSNTPSTRGVMACATSSQTGSKLAGIRTSGSSATGNAQNPVSVYKTGSSQRLTHLITVREARSVFGTAVPTIMNQSQPGLSMPNEFGQLNNMGFTLAGGSPGASGMPFGASDRIGAPLPNIDLTQAAIRLVEQRGVVFIDEIDKLCRSSKSGVSSSDVSDEGVQRDLLPIIEGTAVATPRGTVRTDHILFIAAGAFHAVKPTDLIAELQGRLPIKVKLEPLSEEDMYRVLTDPEHNLLVQQTALLATEGIKLTWHPEAVRELARRATELNRVHQNIGARRLQAVVEKVVEDLSFTAPELVSGSHIEITKEFVEERLKEVGENFELGKFVL